MNNLLIKCLNQVLLKKWFRAYFNHGLDYYIYGNKRLLLVCYGQQGFFLDPFVNVLPCNGSDKPMSMGNLNTHSWDEIWNSERAKEVRDMVEACEKNCWMIGSVAPAMKQKIWVPSLWVLQHKLKGKYVLSENKSVMAKEQN